MVWRAERKIKNGQYNGEWVITKIVGQKGSFKSMVFRRFKPTMQQSTPPIPTGGTYNNPIPDGGLWFDGVPAGDSRTEGPIWASTRIFTDDGVQSNWSSPQLQTDSEDLDIEFSPGIGEEHTQPSNPTGEPFSNREASGWYDSSSINFNSVGPMIWRAERKVDNGQYVGNWTVTRIYGEKGEQGYRGDFVSRVFCRSNSQPATPTGGEYDSPIPTNTDQHGVLIWSDGIPATGPGTIYTSSRKFYGNPDQETELGGTWSTPTIEADSNSLDIEYSTSVIEPSANTLRQTPGTAHPVNTGVNWYDPSQLDQIPTDPTTNKPYPIIWRAERRISGTVYDGDWVITRILGEEGPEGRRGSFKSCVFKRSNSVLNDFNTTDDGATYDSPIPTGWSDGIPSGNEALWMAVSKFTGEGDTHSNWTVTQQTDSSDLDVEFSPGIGAGHDCPPMDLTSNNGNTIFTHPINNYEPNGNPPAKTSARIARENAGWYDASALPSGQTIVWRAERKINGLQQYEGDWVITRIYGEKGDPATLTETQQQDLDSAGLQIVVTPQNIILDQSDALTGATDDKIDDITASIVVYNRTGTALANNQYQIKATDGVTLYATNGQIINGVLQPLTPLTDYVEVSGANLTDTKSVKIKNLPITTTTENGNSTYTYTYNKGYIRVILTVPVGTSTKDVRIDIPWYLNKLGERETKIRGDVASTYMSRTVFSNPADPTISAFTASILDGADGRMANYGLLKSKTGGGYEAAFDAQYIQTASENVAKLTKSMTTSNLIADNGWSNTFSSTQINNKYKTACSPFVYLKVGRYIFSTYINSNTSVNNNIKLFAKQSSTKLDPSTLLTDYSNEGWQDISFNGVLAANANTGYEGEYYPSASANPKYVRIYFVFTVETSGTFQEGYYTFHVSQNNTNFTTCLRPQLEICLDSNTDQMPTTWTPGPQDFSSEIKQTADEITTELVGPGGSLSQVKQTLTDITSTVKGIQEGGENLILNGAFQEGTGGTLNWIGWGSPTTREIVTVNGRKWMHIVSTTAQYQGYQQQHSSDFNVQVIPGEKYTLSFRAYSNSGTANVCMGFHWKADSTTTTISSQDWYAFDVSTTPTIYSQTITIPSGVYYFNVMVGDRTTSAQNFYMTEIKFEKGEVATAWSPTRLDTYSKIQQTANSISLQAGVSENTLNTAGLYLRAGQNEEPSMVKVMAGQFKVVLPPEEEGDPEEIIFGNDPSTNTMVFSGDLKTGEEWEYYSFPAFRTNKSYSKGDCVSIENSNYEEIQYQFTADHPAGAWKSEAEKDYKVLDVPFVHSNIIESYGGGRLGGGKIYWNSNGDIYLGPIGATPKGNVNPQDDFISDDVYEDGQHFDVQRRDKIFKKLYGGKYPTDGIRIINNGWNQNLQDYYTTISIQADSNLELSLGRLTLDNQGMISISHRQNDGECNIKISKNQGFEISRKEYINTGDSDRDELYGFSGAMTISHASLPEGCTGSPLINSSDEDTGDYGSHNFSLKTYVKGRNGKAYKGFTGMIDGGLTFINGICIGPSSGFNSTDDKNPWRAYGQST